MSRPFAWFASLGLLAACHSSPPAPVPLAGDAASCNRMAGVWEHVLRQPGAGADDDGDVGGG